MSRTTKDKSSKLRHPEDFVEHDNPLRFGWYGDFYSSLRRTKKRKELDTEHHWMSTPGWWNKLMHTRPERRKTKVMLTVLIGRKCLEDADVPDLGRKPHIYYW